MEQDILKSINQIGIVFFEKDLHFRYTSVNEVEVQNAGCDSPKEVLGKTDYDLIWKDCGADGFRQADIKIISGSSKFNYLETVKVADGIHDFLITKTSLRDDQDNLIGILGSAIRMDGYVVTKKKGYFSEDEQQLYLGEAFGEKKLSKRELQVFKCILHAFTDPQTASFLKLSVSTIRSIIRDLKRKLQCRSKLEIARRAIENGWTYFINESHANHSTFLR